MPPRRRGRRGHSAGQMFVNARRPDLLKQYLALKAKADTGQISHEHYAKAIERLLQQINPFGEPA